MTQIRYVGTSTDPLTTPAVLLHHQRKKQQDKKQDDDDHLLHSPLLPFHLIEILNFFIDFILVSYFAKSMPN